MATNTCGQVRPAKLSITTCEYWICLENTVMGRGVGIGIGRPHQEGWYDLSRLSTLRLECQGWFTRMENRNDDGVLNRLYP